MKRILVAAITAAITTVGMSNSAKAQVEQGSILIDPYVGAPTGNAFWGTLSSETGFETVGPPISFGGRFEYMVADNFGLGIDANYAISGYRYIDEDYYYDSNTGTYSDAEYKYRADKLRIMLRLNYHFVQTDNLDIYAGFGGGYKNTKRRVYIAGSEDADASLDGIIPVAVRIAIGGRYYFHPNIGLNFELGAGGGGIVQAGLAVKF